MASAQPSTLEFKFKYIEKKSVRDEKFNKSKLKLFSIFNWGAIICIVAFSFFTSINHMNDNNWNMHKYCDVEKFNNVPTPTHRKLAFITIISLAILTILMMAAKMKTFDDISKDFIDMVNYLVGFVLTWDVTYILKNLISYPNPSFYKQIELKMHFCCQNCPAIDINNPKFQAINYAARGSFPSFLMCALLYTTTYFFLYTSHLDPSQSFAIKLLCLFVPGFVCTTYGWLLWFHNENHLEDIVAGALIGTLIAIYIIRNLVDSKSKFDRFTDNFITVLMAREFEMAQNQENNENQRNYINEYTIHLNSDAAAQMIPSAIEPPPSYSSVI